MNGKNPNRCRDGRYFAAHTAFAEVIGRRERSGLSQEALAEAAGAHHTLVGLVERGKRKPTIDVAERLVR
jgi:transcriptional regulator with XRE-family HTH domain